MPCYRVTLLTNEPEVVFKWVEANVPPDMVVRLAGCHAPDGWVLKCVFKRQDEAEKFHRRWHPNATDHTVARWE